MHRRISRDGLILLGVVVAGLAIRAIPVFQTDFPLNDGGMFAAATEDLRANSWRLPEHLSYNDAGIPFAYPPLAFYVAGILVSLGLSTPDALRAVALVASAATVPAFYLLVRKLVDRNTALMATAVFAVLPRTFNWMVAGGGATRALGLLLAVLCLQQLTRRNSHPPLPGAVLAGVFGGLCLLTHIEMAWFVLYSGAAILASGGLEKTRIARFGLAAAVSALFGLSWFGPVVAMHGLDPFISAGQAGNTLSPVAVRILAPALFDEPFFPTFAALGFLGLLWSLGQRQWLLPVWVAAIFIFDARKSDTLATLPFAILAAVGLMQVCLPLLARPPSPGGERSLRLPQRLFLYAVFGVGLAAAALSGFASGSPLRGLSPANRAAMEWVAGNTPTDATFLIVSGETWWSLDASSEWFPYVAGRESVGTVQGFEWQGTERYRERAEDFEQIQDCARSTVRCVVELRLSDGAQASHIYVVRQAYEGLGVEEDEECCEALRATIAQSASFELLFENEGGSVYRRR